MLPTILRRSSMRVALVYDRINKIGGAEQVLLAFHELYPKADWYTGFWDPLTALFSQTWRIHSFPLLHTHHEWFPWLMPFIFESFDLSSYDLVISIGSAEAKGIITRPGTIHLHYCLTPTRYLYSHAGEYLSNWFYRTIALWLRKWDLVAATRPDIMIAISTQVKNRIQKYYHRDSETIFPPVDTKRFTMSNKHYDFTTLQTLGHKYKNYFLVVSRLVPYKKIDILIRAANLTKSHLIIIGQGSDYRKLKQLAGPTVTLLGHVSEKDLPGYYQNCLAYLQANEEDFGISMVEAQASGKSVIAYARGGALDIVLPGKTGLLLQSNSVESFAKAMVEFDTMSFAPSNCRANARRFDKRIWAKQMTQRIKQVCQLTR